MDGNIALSLPAAAVVPLWTPTLLMNVTPHLIVFTAVMATIFVLGIVHNTALNRMFSNWQIPIASVLGVPDENSLIDLVRVVRLCLMPPPYPLGPLLMFLVPRIHPMIIANLMPLLCSHSVTGFPHSVICRLTSLHLLLNSKLLMLTPITPTIIRRREVRDVRALRSRLRNATLVPQTQ